MKYLTKEQQAVVEARMKDGYDYVVKANGNYLLFKKRHTLEINGLGYDCYVSTSLFN